MQDTAKQFGRVRLSDDSLRADGYRRGSILTVEINAKPKRGELAAVYSPLEGLQVRHVARDRCGCLMTWTSGKRALRIRYGAKSVIVIGRIAPSNQREATR